MGLDMYLTGEKFLSRTTRISASIRKKTAFAFAPVP